MFIDQSYFIGPLTIAQLGQGSVDDSLMDFINRWEATIMEAALGYDFYQAFLNGLEVGSDEQIEQRWLDLLNGVVFINTSGIKKRFAGFAGGSNSSTLITSQRDDLFIYGGITSGFPVNGNSYIDPSLAGWNFEVEIFGAGTIDPGIKWNYISTGGIQLTDANYQVQPGEQWVLHFTGKKLLFGSSPSSSSNQLSPLAGFIYYEYMKDLATQATGIGIVKSNSENSVAVSPIKKMCYAYNSAVDQIRLFWELMQADYQKEVRVYPEFDPMQVVGFYYGWYNRWQYWWNYRGVEQYSFRHINPFGI